MEFWINLGAIIQILAAIAGITGLSAVQIITYFLKGRSVNLSTTNPTQPLNSPSKYINPKPSTKHNLGWLDLAMALLIGSCTSLFSTYWFTCFIRILTYFPFPVKHSELPSLKDLLAVNFSDPRFNTAFITGMIAGIIIGGWVGRGALRHFSQGKGIIDWFLDS